MILLLSIAFSAYEEALFIGNSYTSANQLDLLWRDLAEEGNEHWDAVETRTLAAGGRTLADHWAVAQDESTDWYASLHRPWHHVLLQDQSQVPSFSENSSYVIASTEGAIGLNGLIQEQGAETLFLLTWGRRDGDSQNPGLNPDYETMQANLLEGYLRYVDATSTDERPSWLAPAGLAFGEVKEADGQEAFEALYSPDGSHPSALGTYLVACVVYTTVTGRSAVGLPMDEDWSHLQEAANHTVLDEPFSEWSYPWVWDELPEDGVVGGGWMRPLVALASPAERDVELIDARLWIQEGGALSGDVSIDELSELVVRGSLVGDVDGPVLLMDGVLESSSLGALVQTGGLLRTDGLSIDGSATMGEVDIEEGDHIVITAASFDLTGLVVPEQVLVEEDGSTLTLSWPAEGADTGAPGSEGCGCGGGLSGSWLLGGLLLWRRRWLG